MAVFWIAAAVNNGDILTDLDCNELLAFHRKQKAQATIAVNKRNVKIDYGVIEFTDQQKLNKYIEKPQIDYHVSMGIYIFEPEVLKYIRKNEKLDLPDLINKLVQDNKEISIFQSEDYWLDIGRIDDYEIAQRDFNAGK